MPTDQSTEVATTTDRRTFLTRTAIGGALVGAGAVASPWGGLITFAGAQEGGGEVRLTDAVFAGFATPLELAAVVAYQTAIDGGALDAGWTADARLFQSHHQEVADLLATLVGDDAPVPVADEDLVAQANAALEGASGQGAVLSALAGIEDTLSATHLSVISQLADGVTAKTVTQVLTTEGQQAAYLAVGGGAAVAEVTPASASTDGALSPTPTEDN